MKTETQPITVGPLTADEWASFALGEDPRNPMPPCCGNLSEVRDAIFKVLRAGGDPELFWRSLAAVWHVVEDHDTDEGTGLTSHPTMVKLFEAYVAGRERPNEDESFAHLLAQNPDRVHEFISMAPDMWDLNTAQGRTRAVARLAGAFVAFVLDPDERLDCAVHLADVLSMPHRDVCAAVDVLRLHQKLPYSPTHRSAREM